MSVAAAAAPRARLRLAVSRPIVLALLLVAELAVLGLVSPGYLDPRSLLDTSRTFAEAGILACGMTLVIVTGGIDLSVASLMALVSVAIGFSHRAGLPLPAAVALGLVTGVAGGAANGVAIASLRLHPFVVTLATMSIYRGAAYALSNAQAVSDFPPEFTWIGQGYVFGGLAPVQLLLFAAVAAGAWALLAKTVFGRRVYGIGANELAARFSGAPVTRVKIAVYTLSGLLAAVAEVVQTARVSTARANAAQGLELTVIAMVVLGGVRTTGGAGGIGGAVLGVLLLAYLQDGLTTAGVRNDWGLVVVGALIVLGAMANEIVRRRPR